MSQLRRSLRRLVTAGVLAGALGATQAVVAPAAHAFPYNSESCPHAESTRYVTATVLGKPVKLWLWQQDDHQTHICFATGPAAVFGDELASGDIYIYSPLDGPLVPTVTPVTGDNTCPEVVRTEDPLPFVIEAGQAGLSICFGIGNNAAYRVTIGAPGVSGPLYLVVFMDGGTVLRYAVCFLSEFNCAHEDGYVRIL